MNSAILVINAGSSSIKAAIYSQNQLLEDVQLNDEHPDQLINALLAWINEKCSGVSVDIVGHRIVHGGNSFSEPTVLTANVRSELEKLVSFDPDHLPSALHIVEVLSEKMPNVPQLACFDTAFFNTLPRVAQIVALPRRYEAVGLRKYGFHGLSYQSLLETLNKEYSVDVESSRIICAHLGSGASLAAIKNGKPIDTTMSMTPASGIPMSTRSGSIDPGIVKYLYDQDNVLPEEFDHIINKESGLLGISETSADMHTLLEQEDVDIRSREAIDVFCYEIKKSIGSLAAAMNGVDVLVFAGGIGEKAPKIRERVCDGLEHLGIKLHTVNNNANNAVINVPDAPTAVYALQTNEALVMMKQLQDYLIKQTVSGEKL